MEPNETDRNFMRQAIELASQSEGAVEPNPMVGCVLVRDQRVIGQGWHQQFGGPHAEVNALNSCDDPQGCVAYVTLEPCCHQGKTGPCTQALIDACVGRVVVGVADPFAKVAGQGIEQLKSAGIETVVGVEAEAARELVRPYLKTTTTGLPWVIAKWAMTMDGKIATAGGQSKWISCEASRTIVHQIRGRVDAVIVGIGTALADDPMLTARPAGPRPQLRVVVDPQCQTPLDSKLVKSAAEFPVAIAVADANCPASELLRAAGCQIIDTPADDYADRLEQLLAELGRQKCTNVLVEGGGSIFGAMNDGGLIDEVHCFVAPTIFGGNKSASPIGGTGIAEIAAARQLQINRSERIDNDFYIVGRYKD